MKLTFIISLLTFSIGLFAQNGIIATIGNQKINTDEFMWAFNKNNKSEKPKQEALKEYLDLHINYKLKVLEAYSLKLDTSVEKRQEYSQLYNTMADKYISEENIYTAVVAEAFKRLQTDRMVKHIYVKVDDFKNAGQVALKTAKIDEALKSLNKKEAFSKVALLYSEDESTKNNGGEIGAITCFTLPYELENIIYNAKIGVPTKIITSKTGFHIFLVTEERKALGTIYARQILLASQMHQNDAHKAIAEKTYAAITKKPSSFDSLVTVVSNDQSSINNKGVIAPFSIGQYESAFERGVLTKNPKNKFNLFKSDLGWHITILDSTKGVPSVLTNNIKDSLVNIIKFQDRGRNAKDNYIGSMLPKLNYQQNTKISNAQLITIAENIIAQKETTSILPSGITEKDIMHSFPKLKVTVSNWVSYLNNIVKSPEYNSKQPLSEVLNNYVIATAREYYVNNYADYNTDFKFLMNEFKDGNVYFDFMQQMVWNKASEDEAGLKSFYEKNASKYVWKPGASGIIITANSEAIAKEIYDAMKKNPNSWTEMALKYNDNVRVDSSRFEFENILIKNVSSLKEQGLTNPQKLDTDNWYTFMYVTKLHKNETPRNYEDAKGLAVNDYQLALDTNLQNALKKKYTVSINQEELKSVLK